MKKKRICLLLSLMMFSVFLLPWFAGTEAANAKAALPQTSARAALVMEKQTRTVLFAQNEDEELPMASTTKIMSALVVLENCALDEVVTITEESTLIEGSSIYMVTGEKLTVEELLYAMLMESGNDAANALAIHTAGSEDDFAAMMNEKAAQLELKHTHFDNASGLDGETHFTTAKELALITCEAMKYKTFCDIAATEYKKIPKNGELGGRTLTNHNRLLKMYEGANGVKTGYTMSSGRSLVSSATRDGSTLIAVTIRDPNDWQDHERLLDYGFSQITDQTLLKTRQVNEQIPVVGGDKEQIAVYNSAPVSASLPEGVQIQTEIEAPAFVYAPVKKGDVVGKVVLRCEDSVLGSSDLIASENVAFLEKESWWDKIIKIFK